MLATRGRGTDAAGDAAERIAWSGPADELRKDKALRKRLLGA